jgi:hypothetical protein
MEYDYVWGNNNSDVQRTAKYCGLKSPQPIMCNTRESGNCLTMFQAGSKYYVWNPVNGAICEIVTSMGPVDIVTEIGKMGLGSLVVVEVDQVSTSG